MSENTSETQSILSDGAEAIVTKGTKSLPKDTRVTVIGHDKVVGSYTVRTPDGRLLPAKEDRIGPAPEKTFTASEIRATLQAILNAQGVSAQDAVNGVAEDLGLEWPTV